MAVRDAWRGRIGDGSIKGSGRTPLMARLMAAGRTPLMGSGWNCWQGHRQWFSSGLLAGASLMAQGQGFWLRRTADALGQDGWPRASGGTATMNTSMSFTLPPSQVELNSMRVKSRLTVPCGSSSYW